MKDETFIDKLLIILLIYPFGISLLLILSLFRLLGIVNILNKERFPHNKGRLVVVSNHPSLLEPIIIPLLFYKEYLRHPFKLRPFSTPDKTNYYDKWYWYWLLRLTAIPIDRGNRRSEVKAFRQMIDVINNKGIIIIFPEGGRTGKGKNFYYSEKGKKIRPLKQGIASLVSRTGSLVLFVWIDGAEKVMPIKKNKLYVWPRLGKIIIKIGKTIQFEKGINKEKALQKIQTNILELADE